MDLHKRGDAKHVLGIFRIVNTHVIADEGARIAVKEAQWYMDHAEITAPADGVLVLAEGRAELLVNKAVRTGDKLFDVYSGQGVIAEIMVNERESSILLGDLSATLFLLVSP